jgi:alginate O-acetyltransferase complex protein AlgI
MSLGSFFRDYVYIPMGGNRRHQALNIMTVWFLTGMWHGASWNFIIWGVYFGLIVMAEKHTILRMKERIPSVALHIYSLLLVVIGWGLFYFDDFEKMQVFFKAFVGITDFTDTFMAENTLFDKFWLWIIAFVFCMPVRSWTVGLLEKLMPGDNGFKNSVFFLSRAVVALTIIVLSVALLVGATNNAFIYTRF